MSEREEMTPEELEEQDGEPLPDREALSIVDPSGESGFVDLEIGNDPPELQDADK